MYHGHNCTNKYISNPGTVNDDKVLLTDLPPIQWSLCKQFTIGTCIIKDTNYGGIYGFLFQNEEYYESEEECVYDPNVIPNHAESKESFWQMFDRRPSALIKEIDLWNRSTNAWDRIFTSADFSDEEENQKLFRLQIIFMNSRLFLKFHLVLGQICLW